MALSIVWAGLVGAGLGLDRNLRNLRYGPAACAVSAAAGAFLVGDLQLGGLIPERWLWPVAAAATTVSLGYYLAATTDPRKGQHRFEPQAALVAACAFGVTLGLGADRFAGLMGLIALFALAWRPLDTPQAETAPRSGLRFDRVDIGRRAEEGRNDDEGGQQGEEQGQGEKLAHAGGTGVT